MARSQKKRCEVPSFAAVPTQLEPTTKTICVRTRSPSPSGFLSTTLCSSTMRSTRCNSGVIVGALKRRRVSRQFERSETTLILTLAWREELIRDSPLRSDWQSASYGLTLQRFNALTVQQSVNARLRISLAAAVRFEIRDDGLFHQRTQCKRHFPRSRRRAKSPRQRAAWKIWAI